jgi:aerobic carbon-monoxide dehydrogenase small subunit
MNEDRRKGSGTDVDDGGVEKKGITRRGFIKSVGLSGAAAGFATVIPQDGSAGVKTEGKSIVLNVNGRSHRLRIGDDVGQIQPSDTLAHVLRETLDLTGTKTPCDRGECGGCTVLMDGEPVLSCSTLAVECEGKKIQTIEGIADATGKLDPIQEAIIEHDAIQCGMCTPGIVLSLKSLFNRNPKPSRQEIREALSGNLCRCTGYVKYIDAAESVAKGGVR